MKAMSDLGIVDSPRWSNYFIHGKPSDDLIAALEIPGILEASYIVDPAGCVVHSSLSPTTMRAVIMRSVRSNEACMTVPGVEAK